MPIVIKDETANATVLTIDNNGNMAFADGTPINSLTLNGYGIIDSEGYIVHGLGSNSVQPSEGMVTTGVGQSVIIYTLPGVIPTAVCDASYPASRYWILYPETIPGHPPPTHGDLQEEPILAPTFAAAPEVGYFYINSASIVQDDSIMPGGANYQPQLQNISLRYRWI